VLSLALGREQEKRSARHRETSAVEGKGEYKFDAA